MAAAVRVVVVLAEAAQVEERDWTEAWLAVSEAVMVVGWAAVAWAAVVPVVVALVAVARAVVALVVVAWVVVVAAGARTAGW